MPPETISSTRLPQQMPPHREMPLTAATPNGSPRFRPTGCAPRHAQTPPRASSRPASPGPGRCGCSRPGSDSSPHRPRPLRPAAAAPERPRVVQRLQRRHLHVRELQAEEPPARPQHAPRLGQHRRLVGAVAQAERDRHAIHRTVRQRQPLGIGDQQATRRRSAARDSARSRATSSIDALTSLSTHRAAALLAASASPISPVPAGKVQQHAPRARDQRRDEHVASTRDERQATSGRSSGRSAARRCRTRRAPCRPSPRAARGGSRNRWSRSMRGCRSCAPSIACRTPMPELPEVETVMRGLQQRLEGRVIVRADGPPPRPALAAARGSAEAPDRRAGHRLPPARQVHPDAARRRRFGAAASGHVRAGWC